MLYWHSLMLIRKLMGRAAFYPLLFPSIELRHVLLPRYPVQRCLRHFQKPRHVASFYLTFVLSCLLKFGFTPFITRRQVLYSLLFLFAPTSPSPFVVLVLAVSYFASVYLGQSIKLKMLVERIFILSKRFFGVPSFFNYAIADGIFNLLYPHKTAFRGIKQNSFDDFQVCFDFG